MIHPIYVNKAAITRKYIFLNRYSPRGDGNNICAYTCSAGSSGTCRMRCNDSKAAEEVTLSCEMLENVIIIVMEINAMKSDKCKNANNLYVIVETKARECLKNANISLPDNVCTFLD